MARRFGSAMISNTDSTVCIYSTENIRVKVYNNEHFEVLSRDREMRIQIVRISYAT